MKLLTGIFPVELKRQDPQDPMIYTAPPALDKTNVNYYAFRVHDTGVRVVGLPDGTFNVTVRAKLSVAQALHILKYSGIPGQGLYLKSTLARAIIKDMMNNRWDNLGY